MWIPPLCSNLQGPPLPGKERMGHALSEAHGSKKNIYKHDGGFPLRIIIQQLQDEAKYLSVLTWAPAEAPFGHRKPLLVQSLPFISEQYLILTVFYSFPWTVGLQEDFKTVLATEAAGKGFFFLSWSDMRNWIVCFHLYHQPYFIIPELCLPPLLCCTPSALQGHCSLVIFWNF